jgi:hypothetical protein
MSRGKKKDQSTATTELNTLMSTYRNSVLPTPILLWRTVDKNVAAWELSDDEFKRVVAIIGIDL